VLNQIPCKSLRGTLNTCRRKFAVIERLSACSGCACHCCCHLSFRECSDLGLDFAHECLCDSVSEYEPEKSRDLKTREKGATLKNNMRGALRIATAMVGLAFGLVPLHHERRSLLRIRGACFSCSFIGSICGVPLFRATES